MSDEAPYAHLTPNETLRALSAILYGTGAQNIGINGFVRERITDPGYRPADALDLDRRICAAIRDVLNANAKARGFTPT